jgi:hypothetical protein
MATITQPARARKRCLRDVMISNAERNSWRYGLELVQPSVAATGARTAAVRSICGLQLERQDRPAQLPHAMDDVRLRPLTGKAE